MAMARTALRPPLPSRRSAVVPSATDCANCSSAAASAQRMCQVISARCSRARARAKAGWLALGRLSSAPFSMLSGTTGHARGAAPQGKQSKQSKAGGVEGNDGQRDVGGATEGLNGFEGQRWPYIVLSSRARAQASQRRLAKPSVQPTNLRRTKQKDFARSSDRHPREGGGPGRNKRELRVGGGR